MMGGGTSLIKVRGELRARPLQGSRLGKKEKRKGEGGGSYGTGVEKRKVC